LSAAGSLFQLRYDAEMKPSNGTRIGRPRPNMSMPKRATGGLIRQPVRDT